MMIIWSPKLAFSSKQVLLLHCLILVIICSFVLFLHVVMLSDLPNHMARMYIYHQLDKSSYLSQFYYRKFEWVPYLGLNLFFGALLPFFNVYTVAKLLICFYIVGCVAAILYLSEVVNKKIEISTFLIYAVILNSNFFWGFINYCFTIPFIILAFATWIKLENTRYWGKIIFFIFSQFLYFMHCFAFVILILITAAYELQKNNFWLVRRFQSAVKFLSFLIVCMIIPLLISLYSEKALSIENKTLFWWQLRSSLKVAISPFLFNNEVLAIFFLLLVIFAYLTRTLIIEKNKVFLTIAIVLCFMVPTGIDSIFGVYLRLPVVVTILLFAMSKFNENKNWLRKITAGLMFLFIPVALIYYGSFLWQENKVAINYLNGLKAIAPGAKILTVQTVSSGSSSYHMMCLAGIERQAFIPSLFNNMPPLRTKELYLPISSNNARVPKVKAFIESQEYPKKTYKHLGDLFYWRNWLSDFNYLDYIHTDGFVSLGDAVDNLPIVYQDKIHTIYLIHANDYTANWYKGRLGS